MTAVILRKETNTYTALEVLSDCTSHILRQSQFRHHRLTQSNPNIAPLFVHRSLWRHFDGGGKSKYCITGNFSSQTFMGAK